MTGSSTPQPSTTQQNRRLAGRLVAAVLLFHALALAAGAALLRQAMQGPVLRPVEQAAPLQARPAATLAPVAARPGADLPDWAWQARHQDTAAPWHWDAQGQLHLAPGSH